MSDAINPDHYKRLPAEAIFIIESAIQGAPSVEAAYLHGQVLKYILRCWSKNGIEDLKKAKWYLDRLIDSFDESEQQKASDLQSLKDHPSGKPEQPKWTPKVGDWVRIKKPSDTHLFGPVWVGEMDKYDGQIIEVKEIIGGGIVQDRWGFLFDWLQPAEQPKALAISDKIPEGYRKLNDSSVEPRKLGDLRWSISQKRYVEIGEEEIGYANRDNWAACRRVEPAAKQSLTTEPPDGWRFLKVGEVIRNGDRCFTNNGGSIDCLTSVGEKFNHEAHYPTIRRNRFEVGEKVIEVRTGRVYEIESYSQNYDQYSLAGFPGSCVNPEHLAPYIESTKRYREPTPADLKNGPIDCEVRNSYGEPWVWRILCYIADGSDRPFRVLKDRLKDSKAKWPHCRIEVTE